MDRIFRKYILLPATLLLCGYMVFGVSLPSGSVNFVQMPAVGSGVQSHSTTKGVQSTSAPSGAKPTLASKVVQPQSAMPHATDRQPRLLAQAPPPLDFDIAVPSPQNDTTSINLNAPDTGQQPGTIVPFPTTEGLPPVVPSPSWPGQKVPLDSVPKDGRFLPDSYYSPDSTGNPFREVVPGTPLMLPSDSLAQDSVRSDTARRKPQNKNFLNEPISSKNKDSIVFAVRDNMVYIFNQGDVTYQKMNLKADYISVNLENKNIHAYGITDTVAKVKTRPEFTEGGQVYTMDTITHNLETNKSKIKGVAMQEGDGFLVGQDIKKMKDNTINIEHGKYTTCDHIYNPHFYLSMSKAKVIPGKKIIIGPTYFVMEDVKIPFLGVPFGFFPLISGRKSGFIIPSYGEETAKGFFLRNGGYYFAFNDYIDITLTGGIYTLGSWETRAQSRYIKRYKFSGSLSASYSKVRLGEKGSADYVNQSTMNFQWTHRQDPKFRPNSNFSASVNFSTSGYNKYGSNTMNDYLNTQTSSSIAYSKSWPGKPFTFATDMRHSQNSADSTISITFPNIVFNMTTIYPFRRKERIGKERWYEKISILYSGNLTNRVTNVKEYDLLNKNIIDKMSSGISHSIPLSTSFSFFNYLNFSPTARYAEQWGFRSINREWSPEKNAVQVDTTYGFYRNYSYDFSGSFNTRIYGEFQFLGKDPIVRAIRHVMTPTLSFTYTPDFSNPKYGFVKSYQSDSTGTISTYSPMQGNAYFSSPSGASARISFSLSNSLEMKVRSRQDTAGFKKVKVIDNLSLGGSYNFLAESFKLSTISWSIRSSIIKGLGLNVSGTIDPYYVDSKGKRIDKLMWKDGKFGRISSASTSFGYSFNSGKGTRPAVNDVNSGSPVETVPAMNDFFDERGEEVDPATKRALMTSQYYDFDIPWNLSFNYSVNYSNSGARKDIYQTMSFNGAVTLTPKWGVTFNGGYDFEAKKLTPGVFTINRDLHCWQMSFSWVPVGFRKSWSFNIHIKSSVLQDIKYDKTSSYYDNIVY